MQINHKFVSQLEFFQIPNLSQCTGRFNLDLNIFGIIRYTILKANYKIINNEKKILDQWFLTFPNSENTFDYYKNL